MKKGGERKRRERQGRERGKEERGSKEEKKRGGKQRGREQRGRERKRREKKRRERKKRGEEERASLRRKGELAGSEEEGRVESETTASAQTSTKLIFVPRLACRRSTPEKKRASSHTQQRVLQRATCSYLEGVSQQHSDPPQTYLRTGSPLTPQETCYQME